jgi:hypothetical protein
MNAIVSRWRAVTARLARVLRFDPRSHVPRDERWTRTAQAPRRVMSWARATAVTQQALLAVVVVSTLGVLSLWLGTGDLRSPEPPVASGASALMLIGLVLGSPLALWVSARAWRAAASDPARVRSLRLALRRRAWALALASASAATALEVSRAGVSRIPRYLVQLVPLGELLGALSVAMLVSALVFGGSWPWVRRWLGRAALGWGGAMGLDLLSRWLGSVPTPPWRWPTAHAHLLDVSVVLVLGYLGVSLLGLRLLRRVRPALAPSPTLSELLAAPPGSPAPAPPAPTSPPLVLPRHPSGRVRRAFDV